MKKMIAPLAFLGCALLTIRVSASVAPFLGNFGDKAALLSALLQMPEGGISYLNGEAEYYFPYEDTSSVSSDTSSVSSEAVQSGTSSQTASSEAASSSQAPIERPADAGDIVDEEFATTGSSSSYIQKGNGFIRNTTNLSRETIEAEIANKPDITITEGTEPQVLIMHTHTTESYELHDTDFYDKTYNARSLENSENMVRVGDEIVKQLENAGIGVLHDATVHDYPSYNGAYDRSAETVKKYLAQYPSIKVVIDVHRDAIERDGGVRVAPTTTINGKKAAQFMLIAGCDDGTMNMPNYMQNLRFAAMIQDNASTMFPTLARPVLFSYRHYNQDLTYGSLLVEVGGHANTLDEAIYTGELFGKALAKTLEQLKG
ncbi:MAG TPA: stage II sporulation protein P [Firmicutes bacterium]|nr:stage II sporulation protein P [Bacillota bacterium]